MARNQYTGFRDPLAALEWITSTAVRDPVSGCLELGTNKSYGAIQIKRERSGIHRFVYRMLVGPIPDGMLIRHLCNNKRCVEKTHLALGTTAQNANDAVLAGSARRKLTSEQVREIRASTESSRTIAPKYGVSDSVIRAIRRFAIWKVVP